MLKDRVSRLESMSNVLREGIKNIQPNECSCHQTAELFKQVHYNLQYYLLSLVIKSISLVN